MSTNAFRGSTKLGLIFLGRKRPGFDMDWGAGMERAVRETVRQSSFKIFEPPEKAAGGTSLRQVIAQRVDAGVGALVLPRTTMTDRRLADTPAKIESAARLAATSSWAISAAEPAC